MSENTFKSVLYVFQDASKPPQYHRSYEILVKEKEVSVKVTSYSTELHKKDYKITQEQYDNIIALAKNIEAPATKVAQGATGTSSQSIVLKSGKSTISTLSWDSLNEVNEDTQKCVTAIKALVTDLDTLIAVGD